MSFKTPEIHFGPGEIPSGMNGKVVLLDAKVTSCLKWDPVFEEVKRGLEKGITPFYLLELSSLSEGYPADLLLSSASLALSTLLEKIEGSFGVALYKGEPLNQEGEEFYEELAHMAGENHKTYVIYEKSPTRFKTMTYSRIIKDSLFPLEDLGYFTPSPFGYIADQRLPLPEKKEIEVALVVGDELGEEERKVAKELANLSVPLRGIHASDLIFNWSGLATLIVSTFHLSPYLRRALLGFQAAGGQIVSLEGSLSMDGEIPYPLWIKNNFLNSNNLL